jgi:hypothetical protein
MLPEKGIDNFHIFHDGGEGLEFEDNNCSTNAMTFGCFPSPCPRNLAFIERPLANYALVIWHRLVGGLFTTDV